MVRAELFSFNLNDPVDNSNRRECQHFSLRGYVSNMRNIRGMKHWPFGVHESEKLPSFPPLHVPKIRLWACDICQQATAPESNDNKDDDQTDFHCCSTTTLHGSHSNFSVDAATNNSGIQQARKPKSTAAMRDIDLNIPIDQNSNSDFLPVDTENGMDNYNLNLEVSSVASPEVCLGLGQETHTRKRGDEVSDVEQVVSNNINIEHPTGYLPLEPFACGDAVPMGNTSNIVRYDIQEHHSTKFTMGLVTDLSENLFTRSEQITGQGSASHLPSNVSADSQNLSILPDKVDVQEGQTLIKKGQGRKRNFLHDEESNKEPADMFFQRMETEVQNPEGDAKTCGTVPDNRSKDVLVEMSLQTGSFIEKGIFPLHAPRIENEYTLSKGKGKMLHGDEDLDSLFCWKNEKLAEDAFAHKRAKVLPNIPVSIPILSSQGSWNGEGLKERMNLSLNHFSSAETCSKKGIYETKNQLPFSLYEGSSKSHLVREDSEPNIFRASRPIANDISGKGKEVLLEEIEGARNKAKTAQFYGMTAEAAEEGANYQMRKEVADLMARNQYERSLLHVQNRSSLLGKSIQMTNHQTCERTNGLFTREENMLYGNGNSTNLLYPYDGNQFGLTNLRKKSSPFGFEALKAKGKPSSGLYYSLMDARNFDSPGSSRFKRSITDRGYSDSALQAKAGSNLWKSVLKNDFKMPHRWPTLTRSNAAMGFNAAPRKGFSLPTSSSNIEKISFQSASSVNTLPDMNFLNLTAAGRQSTSSFNAGLGARMPERAVYPGACSNNLKIGSSISDRNSRKSGKGESSKSARLGGVSKQFSRPNLESELKELIRGKNIRDNQSTSRPSNTISGTLCMTNRNPADFTVSEEGNAYMINGEDLQLEKSVPDLPSYGRRLRRNQKGKMKEHEKD